MLTQGSNAKGMHPPNTYQTRHSRVPDTPTSARIHLDTVIEYTLRGPYLLGDSPTLIILTET